MRCVYFTEDHNMFRDTVRKFMEQEIAPYADAWEEDQEIPRSVWARMGELGFLGISFPEQYGGSEADLFYSVIFLEETARSMMGGFGMGAVAVQQYMATSHIFRVGSEALKQKYLVPSIEGKKVGALGVTEPNTGSDVAAIRTRAVRDGDSYIINGSKTFITNGVYGDFVTLAVKTDPPAGSKGVSLIVVDKDTPGFQVTRKLRKMGFHSSDTAELLFEDVRVPVSQRVGDENNGFYYIMQGFQLERLAIAACSIGQCQVMMELAIKYIGEREAFGKKLREFQVIRHALADLGTELEAARQLLYHTTWLHEQGVNATLQSSMCKLHCTELSKRIADQCLQVFGGYGYMEEYPISRFYRDVRMSTIVAGTSEIMREIIARQTLDLNHNSF